MTKLPSVMYKIRENFHSEKNASSSEEWENAFRTMTILNIGSVIALIALALLKRVLIWLPVPSGNLVHNLDNFFLPVALILFIASVVTLGGVLPLLSIFRYDESRLRPACKSGATAAAIMAAFILVAWVLAVVLEAITPY